MTAQLTLEHLLWRMRHVNPTSKIIDVTGSGRDYIATETTFAEASERIRALAAGLRDRVGLKDGDIVTIFGWNDRAHFEALLAVPVAGGIANSVNLRLGIENISLLSSTPSPSAIVVSSAVLSHPSVGDDVRRVVDNARKRGVKIVAVDDPDDHYSDGDLSFKELISSGDGTVIENHVACELETAFFFHTSGTTGAPKTFRVSHRAAMLHSLSQATTEATGLSSKDRVLPLAPFFHVNGWGLPLTCLMTGASLVLSGHDLEPGRLIEVMTNEKVSVAAAVPTVWYSVCETMVDRKATPPAELREVLTGGDSLPESIWKKLKNVLGVQVATAWGMTETMACSTYERERPHERAGKPVPLVELRLDQLHDGSDEETLGRLHVRGPFVVGTTSDNNEWFATGDIASLDESGAITLRDREKDLIKSGGEWIATAEMELHLCKHPDVASAAIVPVSDPRWVQRPRAFVVSTVSKTSANDLVDELRAHLLSKFPRWWVPETITIVGDLPKTTVGKINKRALRAVAEAPTSSNHMEGKSIES